MATVTIGAHVQRAIDVFNRMSTSYFALGKTSPWNGEDIPIPESEDTSNIEDIIGYKLIDQCFLVVPDPNGEIYSKGMNWRIVPVENAMEEDARWIYVKAELMYNQFPLEQFRQIGLYTGVTAKPGVSTGKTVLLPSEVENLGVLEVYENRDKCTRYVNEREVITIIIQL